MPNWTGDDGVSVYDPSGGTVPDTLVPDTLVPAAGLITDEWMTPPTVFDPLNEEFKFTVDAAADERTHQLPSWFGRGGTEPDGLKAAWRGSVWCNCPFSDIEPWVAKAWLSVDPRRGPLRPGCIVMILPATRTESRWWQTYVEPWRDGHSAEVLAAGGISFSVRFLNRRTHFIPPPRVKASSPRFGCCLLIWQVHRG